MIVLRLAIQSLRNRWLTALLTVLAIAVSVALLVGVEKVRTGARASFANTISGTDLILGARSGDIQLLLYSVFRIGNATNNMSWKSYQQIRTHPDVAWAVPLSLGDSHRGFRVLGTTRDYFKHYKYRRDQGLELKTGAVFDDLYDAVIGADVAQSLGYKVGDRIVIAHGVGEIGTRDHADKPFRVTGILVKTGTPVDRTVHVSLEAIQAIHIDWQSGVRLPGQGISAEDARKRNLQPRAITAAMVGLKSRIATFAFQRYVNQYRAEALSAVLPGVALHEMWSMVGTAEAALRIVSGMVVVTALLGMVTMIVSTLNERRREIAILRSVGATPSVIFGLLVAEAGVLTILGTAIGTAGVYGALLVLRPVIDSVYGLYIEIGAPGQSELTALAIIIFGGLLAGAFPAWRAYRQSLADGMMVRT